MLSRSTNLAIISVVIDPSLSLILTTKRQSIVGCIIIEHHRRMIQTWDASRVSAAIPSGVGFLGAGLIVKSSEVDPETGERHHLVQGITTAAATWLSAAVGMACGGGMYFVASFATAVNLVLLRFGPRAVITHDESSVGSLSGGTGEFTSLLKKDEETGNGRTLSSYGVPESIAEKLQEFPASMKRSSSLRNRPSLL
jgi:uncharacterized membrane protein YhiD involved in acid resistance